MGIPLKIDESWPLLTCLFPLACNVCLHFLYVLNQRRINSGDNRKQCKSQPLQQQLLHMTRANVGQRRGQAASWIFIDLFQCKFQCGNLTVTVVREQFLTICPWSFASGHWLANMSLHCMPNHLLDISGESRKCIWAEWLTKKKKNRTCELGWK